MFRGERKIWQNRTKSLAWQVDGFACTDHGVKVYEYMGHGLNMIIKLLTKFRFLELKFAEILVKKFVLKTKNV